jgi:spore coat protein A, manganese oxidase
MKPSKLFIVFFAALLGIWTAGGSQASQLVPQTWLPGDTLFPTIGFTQTLPVFGPGSNATLPRVNALMNPYLKVSMKEVDQQVLPPPYLPTKVWAYEISNAFTGKILGPAHWPAVTVEAQRYFPTSVRYVNELPSFNPANMSGPPFVRGLVQGLVTADQSIHWADPLQNTGPMNCSEMSMGGPIDCTLPANAANPCCQVFTGPIPTVPHLHGAENFSGVDGGPEQWFTPTGLRGKDYFSYDHPGPNEAVYRYPNLQEPGTLWFHDHALGITRTNVYSGLATFYFLRDKLAEPRNLPSGAYEIEMALQDRQFDTNAQLFFPDGSPNANGIGICGDGTVNDPCLNGPPPNPTKHPYWIPEFIGDVAIVNGAPWPVLKVEPRRYLFRLLDGSNARMYNLAFGGVMPGETAAPVYVIGSDDNYLNNPVKVNTVFFAPGERVYAIVDFTGLAGKTVTVTNDAPIPFPSGLVPGVDAAQLNMNKIMQFQVTQPLADKKDKSCDPAAGGCGRLFQWSG